MLWLTVLLCTGLIDAACAHDPGLSTLTLKLHGAQLEASATFARKEIETLVASQRNAASGDHVLTQLALDTLAIEQHGRVLKAIDRRARLDGQNNVEFRLTFSADSAGKLTVRSPLIGSLAPGHRQLVSVMDVKGNVIEERLLSAGTDHAELEMRPTPGAAGSVTSFGGFLALGVEHILTGYDHLLFLFSLLIVARSLVASLKLITCFTLAHSITLALATFNVVQLPGSIVEPLIAASIIYVSVENLLRRGPARGRLLLTFAFGLVHGLGFASVLRELGIGASGAGIVMPLLSFNLGVELGQILIAAVLLPLLCKAERRPVFVRRWVPVCSILVTLAGSYWLIQRIWFH